MLDRRYVSKDREGVPLENHDGIFRRVARNLSRAELKYGASKEERQEVEEEFYRAMRRLELLPNSPTLMNAGRELQQLSACFVLPVEDSLESIFDEVKQTALIHQSGGGTGFSFSRLPPEGDLVGSTGGVASGPVSFIRAFDTATEVIKQGGTRRGANMGILDVTHPDILKFIRAKEDGLHLNNFNLSVSVTADFMKRVKAGRDYDLVNPRTGKATGQLNAKHVFELISELAWQTGDPGILFMDRINRDNPNPQLGEIESTNPCVTGDTLVMTLEGPRTAESLVGRPQVLLVDGKAHETGPQGFFSAGTKPVVRITTKSGRSLKLTADHLVARAKYEPYSSEPKRHWAKAGELSPGDRLSLHDHVETHMGKEETRHQREARDSHARAFGNENIVINPRKDNPEIYLRHEEAKKFYLRQLAEIVLQAKPESIQRKPITDQVESVEPAGEREVYDVQVPGVNVFDANGFYVHNCGELPMLPHESCNLASVNLARMVKYEDGSAAIDWERLDRTVRTAVHLLDNVIDMNRYPIPEIEEMSRKTRRIGVGVMGLADLLIHLGVRYDSEEGLQAAEDVMRHLQDETHRASSELAERRGSFPAWEGSIYNGEEPVPMRNSAPTTIAPTGSISIIAGASGGIEPLFALSYVRNVMDNTRLVETNPCFEAVAKAGGFYSEELAEQLAGRGSLETLDVPGWVKEVFRTAHDISPEWHVRMQAAVQKHVDNSVSKTVNFPHDAAAADVAQAYMLAYELGCKGITAYRDGSKSGQVLVSGQAPVPSGVQGDWLPATDHWTLSEHSPRERPRRIQGITERVRTGHGNMYVTVNFDDADKPFEVFGALGKSGGCDSAQLEAVSRLASLALRSGIGPENVIEQLRGITCCPIWDNGVQVNSSPDAVALALERSLRNGEEGPAAPGGSPPDRTAVNGRSQAGKCPECNAPVIFEEGCLMCRSCGWNRCE